MSLLTLPIGRNGFASPRRKSRSFRPSLNPSLEGLELRTVMSGAAAAAIAPHASVAAQNAHSPLQITGVNVTGISNIVGNTLNATVSLTGKLLGQAVTLPSLQVPVTLTGVTTPSATSPTTILHLSLELPDLDVLGLHVRLDNCQGGPVTVDITADPNGGLLGSLLSGLGGALNGSGALGSVAGLTDPTTGGNLLTEVLNDVLGGLAGGKAASAARPAATSEGIPAGDTELLDLHLNPIHLNLLGLHVDTSQICLNLFADPTAGCSAAS